LIFGSSSAGDAASTFQCVRDDGNEAIINACGARWLAASIRAHVAVGDTQGYPERCLIAYAARLDGLAKQWIETGRYTMDRTPQPCGKTMNNDDGLLAKLCPGKAWSYDNKGAVQCALSGMPSTTEHASSSQENGPTLDSTLGWLVANVAVLGVAESAYPDQPANHAQLRFASEGCMAHFTSEVTSFYKNGNRRELTVFSADFPLGQVTSASVSGKNDHGHFIEIAVQLRTKSGRTSDHIQQFDASTSALEGDNSDSDVVDGLGLEPFADDAGAASVSKAIMHAAKLCTRADAPFR
jgi:hypothetical protein